MLAVVAGFSSSLFGAGRAAAIERGPALHRRVLLQVPVGPSAGVPRPVSEEPLAAAQEDSSRRGGFCRVKIESPAYHTTEDGRWDYRVTIVYKNSTVATSSNPDEEAFIKQLWPDQETYKREEQRRFEILLGALGSAGDGYYAAVAENREKRSERGGVSF